MVAIREGRGAAALNEERQREEGLRRGEEWLRGGAPARRSGCVEERSREENLRCCAVAVRGWCGAPARRSGCVEERPREENLRCYGVAVRCWCGAVAVRCWCGVVWWLGTKSEENAKRMKKARRRKGEMRGKTLLRKIRRTTSVKLGNRCNITALCRNFFFLNFFLKNEYYIGCVGEPM